MRPKALSRLLLVFVQVCAFGAPGLATTDPSRFAGDGHSATPPGKPVADARASLAGPTEPTGFESAFEHSSARQVAATFVVTTTADTGAGSFRAAILASNASSGLDQITFDIPGGGVKTIAVRTALPQITGPVVIDATTQPGFNGAPIVVLTGLQSTDAQTSGLFMTGGNSVVRGLVINGFNLYGIVLQNSSNNVIRGNWFGLDPTGSTAVQNGASVGLFGTSSRNVIGGPLASDRNVMSATTSSSVIIASGTPGKNRIQGNFIGLDATGSVAIGVGANGIFENAPDDTIGGPGAGEGNVIAACVLPALYIGPTAPRVVVQGNKIGTDASGTVARPNAYGIAIDGSPNNLIGGSQPNEGNLVSGNGVYGIGIRNAGATGNRVWRNRVGTDVSGTLPLPNGQDGVWLRASSDTIGGDANRANIIAFNGRCGVFDSLGVRNAIRWNVIHDNAAAGIELYPFGLMVNDSLDLDAGSNDRQNFPLLDSVAVAFGTTRIHGRLESKPNTTYLVDFYRCEQCDANHFGEGRIPIGTAAVTTNAAGLGVIDHLAPIEVPSSEFLTATATDPLGNTSEFSQCLCLSDEDQDGLMDCWEQQGWGIDENSDGVVDLDLAGLGAASNHKDLFVEIDAMAGYAPPQDAVFFVMDAFSEAPAHLVQNPDGDRGIRLWCTLDDTTIAVHDLPDAWAGFAAVKDSFFGSVADRASPNAKHILRAKRLVYRYGLWARTYGTTRDDTTSSGLAENSDSRTGGDDFMVTLGSAGWGNTKDEFVHAGTFMHELGHTLGLEHGGADVRGYKPNYFSVMNYTWQVPIPQWQLPAMWRLDYSAAEFAPLAEIVLDERVPLLVPAGHPSSVTAAPYRAANGRLMQARIVNGARTDWSGDGDVLDHPVNADINLVDSTDAGSPGELLKGHNDWANLRLNFRHSSFFTPPGAAPPASLATRQRLAGAAESRELTSGMLEVLRSVPPPRPVGYYTIDGQLDPGIPLVATNAGFELYAQYRDGQVYVATPKSGAPPGDLFAFVSEARGPLVSAPFAKSGQAGAWDALLASRSAETTWTGEGGASLSVISVDSSAAFLEGVIDVELLLGSRPEKLYVAAGRYGAATGGVLLAQTPAGNGDANLDATEYAELLPNLLEVQPPGVTTGARLSPAHPNPATGATRVRLSLSRASDVYASVQDVAGRRVAQLAGGRFEAGDHTLVWESAADATLEAGVYFVVVRVNGERLTTRVVHLR